MKILNIKATNILSFESLDYDFEDEVIALVGENKTQPEQGSNGSGKSGFSQIIYFGYTGDNIRKVVDKKMIRNGQKDGEISITTECKQRNEVLKIERTVSLKSTGRLSIEINGVPQIFATVKEGNKLINDWIGISNEDLKSYFIVCKEFYQSIFKASNTEKLALISRFTNFSSVDSTKNVIEKQLIELNNEKRLLESKESSLIGRLSVYEEQLEKEVERDLEKEKTDRVEEIESEIELLKKQNVSLKEEQLLNQTKVKELEVTLKAREKAISTFTKKISDLPKLEEFVPIFKEIKEGLGEVIRDQGALIKEQEDVQKKRDILSKELRTISINLSGTITCPKCGYKFLTLKETSLECETKKKYDLEKKDTLLTKKFGKLDEEVKGYEEVIAEYFSLKSEKEEEEDVLKIQIRELDRQMRELSSIQNRESSSLSDLQLKISSNKKRVDSNLTTETLLRDQIEKILSSNIETDQVKIKEIKHSIEETKKNIDLTKEALSEKSAKIFNKNEWIGRFKNFKMFLASEQIKNVQNRTNEILKKENSDLRLIIEAFKKDSKGNQKDEITLYVLRDEVESFWYYSGGERAKVELAMIMALQDMINTTNTYGGLQFLSIDEITEGLSEEGLYSIIDAMSFINYPVLLATHIPIQNVKCKSLKIVKENHISRIV